MFFTSTNVELGNSAATWCAPSGEVSESRSPERTQHRDRRVDRVRRQGRVRPRRTRPQQARVVGLHAGQRRREPFVDRERREGVGVRAREGPDRRRVLRASRGDRRVAVERLHGVVAVRGKVQALGERVVVAGPREVEVLGGQPKEGPRVVIGPEVRADRGVQLAVRVEAAPRRRDERDQRTHVHRDVA